MKEFAIKENHLFVKTYTKGKRYVTPTVAVYVLKDLKAGMLRRENPRKLYLNRIGFTASTKLGHAVVRNRCKRIMRQALRDVERETPLRKGNLVVIAAREKAVSSDSDTVYHDLKNALSKLGLIGNKPDESKP